MVETYGNQAVRLAAEAERLEYEMDLARATGRGVRADMAGRHACVRVRLRKLRSGFDRGDITRDCPFEEP